LKICKYKTNPRKVEDHLFFVNAKYNIGIYNAFDFVANRINQIDQLWKKEIHDTQDNTPVEEVWEINDSYIGLFCCGPRYKQKANKKHVEETLIEHVQHERIDSEEYAKFDAPVIHPSPMEEMDSYAKRDKQKAKKCLIY
jgi:hypothetical protein